MGDKLWTIDLWTIDWHAVFAPRHSLLEMIVRGTIMYLLVFVLLSEVAGPGFTAGYSSVTEGAVLIVTLLACSYAVEWLGHRFPAVEHLIREPKLKLIENGGMLRRNMRAELVTTEELLAQLREKGLADCRDVAAAYMEADGRISVIRKKRPGDAT